MVSSGGRMEPMLAAAGGELIRLPVHTKNPITWIQNSLALESLIRREAVDLVHVRSRAPAFAGLRVARATGVPLVATYHGVYRAGGPLKRWYNGVMTRGDLVIANSDYTRQHLLAEHGTDPAKVVAIPRGVDLTRFNPKVVPSERIEAIRSAWGLAPDDARPVVLLAGRLTSWKGQALMIDAFARLQRGDVVLVLAGDDQGRAGYRAELRSRAEAAGLGERVRIVGHCADMPAAYLAADLAVAPSLEPEAFGRTAVEPQAMGRPVLAADHGAARETVVDGHTGWLVAPADPVAWAAALQRAMDLDAEARAAIGRAGQARVARLYSLEAMSAATLAAYASLLASHSAAAR